MGAIQLLIKDQQSYYDKALKTMLKSADAFYLHEHFIIGEGVNEDKLRHAQLLEDILCTDSCELINYIHKKIAGKEIKTENTELGSHSHNHGGDNYTTIINNFNTEMVWNVEW